jgi:PAS domain S-box-containing protein
MKPDVAASRCDSDFFQALFEATTESVLLLDGHYRILAINGTGAQRFGMTVEEMLGRDILGLYDPDTAARRLGCYRQAQTSGRRIVATDRRNGRHYESTVIPIPDPQGGPPRLAIYGRDMTEQLRMETALRESEQNYRVLAEQSTDMILRHAPDGSLVYVSPVATKLLGYRPDEVLGLSVFSFLHPDDLQEALAIFAQVQLHPGTVAARVRARHAAGSWVWLAAPVAAIPGPPPRVITVSRDVSARIEMEEALRESRESFSRIFRLSPVASAVSEWNDGRYLDVNEAFVQTTGFAREEVLGRTSVELGIWRGHGLRAHLVAELDEIQVFSNREFTFRRKDGQIRQGLFSAAAVDFGGPQVPVVPGGGHHRAQGHGGGTVPGQGGGRGRQPGQEPVSGQHEPRDPHAHEFHPGHGRPASGTRLDDLQRRYVDIFCRAGSDLLRIINDILDISKLESEQVELYVEHFNLDELLEKVADYYRDACRAKGLALSCHAAGEAPRMLRGDMVRLTQVATNLLGNAVKFTAEGAVDFSVELLLREPKHALLLFSCADTGIGIDPDRREAVFENFVQAERGIGRGTAARAWGCPSPSGLWSSWAERSASGTGRGRGSWPGSRSGWRRSATGPNGRPSAGRREQAGEDASPPNGAKRSLDGLRLLVVDDIRSNRELVKLSLADTGVRTDEAANGREALELFATGDYQVVVLDMVMPDRDGYDVARLMRRLERENGRPPIPIVALTASAFPEDRQRALDAGCTEHLPKPFSKKTLLAILSAHALSGAASP